MAFWSEKVNPKTKQRFVLVIGEKQVITVKSVTKPKATVDIKGYRMINHTYKYPGLLTWNPITIKLVDMYGDDTVEGVKDTSLNTAKFLRDLLSKSGYQTPRNDGITTAEKASTISNAFGNSIKIQQINPAGDKIVEQWTLVNPIISEINWGEVDYSSDDLIEYVLTVDYDYALFTDTGDVIKGTQQSNVTFTD